MVCGQSSLSGCGKSRFHFECISVLSNDSIFHTTSPFQKERILQVLGLRRIMSLALSFSIRMEIAIPKNVVPKKNNAHGQRGGHLQTAFCSLLTDSKMSAPYLVILRMLKSNFMFSCSPPENGAPSRTLFQGGAGRFSSSREG